ncbi:hypothetical protein C8F01DRAFT_1188767 [Mycena amicta]|nr:hypothetical protein C8F01DRAFT_1188767 [Mycena amicta]
MTLLPDHCFRTLLFPAVALVTIPAQAHSSPTPQASPTDGPRHLAMLCRNALPHATAAKPRQPWSTPPRNALPPCNSSRSCRQDLLPSPPRSPRLKFKASYSWRHPPTMRVSPKLSPSAVPCLAACTVPLHPSTAMLTESAYGGLFPAPHGIDCRYGFLKIRNAVVQGQYPVGVRIIRAVLYIVHMY